MAEMSILPLRLDPHAAERGWGFLKCWGWKWLLVYRRLLPFWLRKSAGIHSCERFASVFFAEDYTEEQAVAHVRRFLDIVACTTAFGKNGEGKEKGSAAKKRSSAAAPLEDEGDPAKAEGKGNKGAADVAAIHPPSKLGQFYDFFSFSHIPSPIQCELLVILLFLS